MKRAVGAAAALVVLALTLSGLLARDSQPPERRAALALYEQARRARIDGHGEREFRLLVDAFETDPTYLPTVADLTRHPRLAADRSTALPLLDSLLARVPNRELAECIGKVVHPFPDSVFQLPIPRNNPGAAECVEFYTIRWRDYRRVIPERSERIVRLWRRYPESVGIAGTVHTALLESKDRDLGQRVGREMARARDPLVQAIGYGLLTMSLHVDPSDSAFRRLHDSASSALARAPASARMLFALNSARPQSLSVDSITAFGDRFGRYDFLRSRAISAYDDGDLVLSERLWNLMLEMYADLPEVQAEALIFRGRTHLKAGRLKEARADLMAGGAVARRAGANGPLMEHHHNLFHVYEGLGDRERALAAGHAFIATTHRVTNASSRMMAYHDLGWYYWQSGDYRSAQPLLARMLALIDSLGEHHHFAGEYYERVGDLDRALEMYERAAPQLYTSGIRSIARLAVLAAQMGDSASAIRFAQEHDSAAIRSYPEFTPQLPGVLASLGLREAALAAIEGAETRARQRKQAAAVANLLLERAGLELELERPAKSLPLADSAAAIARRVAAFETEMSARATRALAAAMLLAQPVYADTIEMLARNAARARLPDLELRLRTMLGRVYAAGGDHDNALAAFARAAALNDSMAASLTNDANRAGLRSARNDVSSRALSLIVRSTAGDAVRRYAEWSIRRKARSIAESRGSARSGALPRVAVKEAVVDFVVLPDVTAALVVTSDTAVLRILPVGARELANDIRSMNEQLTPRIGVLVDMGRARFDALLAHKLYRQLIEPLMSDLAGIDRLAIVADGPLHFLAFDALVTDSSKPDSYLLRRFTIRHVPSLALVRNEPAALRGVVIALPGDAVNAEEEVAAIASSASGPLRVLPIAAGAATEARVRSFIGDARIIHFATHAMTNDVAPLFAYLALKPERQDDGRLHAFEIERLRLNQALVVLSGCDTGGGWLAGGEGVLSLSRVFLRAGASATVATLWPVGRGSPEFMAEFYRQLSLGRSPADALQGAKLHALQGSYASPLYWAPFVLIAA